MARRANDWKVAIQRCRTIADLQQRSDEYLPRPAPASAPNAGPVWLLTVDAPELTKEERLAALEDLVARSGCPGTWMLTARHRVAAGWRG